MELQSKDKITDLKKIVENKVYGKVNKRWLLITIIVAVFVIVAIFGSTAIAYEIKYKDKFFPGSRIGDISLSGLTTSEAINLLDQITRELEDEEIRIIYKNNGSSHLKITPAINALSDPDLSRDLLIFDNHKTVHDAFEFGRNKNWGTNFINKVGMFFEDKTFDAKFILDESMMQRLIKQEFSEMETIAQNTIPKIVWQGNNYSIEFLPEQEGVTINYSDAMDKIKNDLKQLKNNPITLTKETDKPLIRLEDITDKNGLIDSVLSTTTPKIVYDKYEWEISKYDLSQMLGFLHNENKEIIIGLNQDLFSIWLEENIASEINIEPKDASIEMIDGRVTKFEAHRDGKSINSKDLYEKINSNLALGNIIEKLSVDIISPDIKTGDINDMGIKEIVGTGHSNFAGSPFNRRHNIRTGANALHGILIKPNEEFSLITTLGDIDGENGYKQELVIKGNETIAEYGGGLCQIGTTMFRATMGSGLDITARRNHSYNVSYYLENGLPGTDATIYDPWPDFKFINDTENFVLIQARIEGNDLYFDFWGTRDGRKAERTTPSVWGWTDPEPTKYIETLDLPVGETKCTERAHKGVSASFDYIVTYVDGEKEETTFSSRYRPWQEVCLIGVEELSEETATSTENII
jgi:vancomycin resistance protein YoaR